jgi:acyl-lipid omega-6 desaturase (Delta-12 desaturase)
MPMRSGKALILATREFAKEDRLKSWTYTLSTFFILIALLAGTLLSLPLVVKLVCSVLAGLVIVRAFTIYHDYLHDSILQKSALAEVLMTGFGVFVLSPPSIWKLSHDYHHKHNSKLFAASIGSYPIMTKKRFLSASPAERFKYLAIRHPLSITFGYLLMFLYGMCINPLLRCPKKHLDCGIAVVVHAGLMMALYGWGGWLAVGLTITLPFFIACAMGSYLFYAQHNFPGVVFKNSNHDWNYACAAMESSSYMEMGPVMRWFTGNIGYHHIHHINSRIPFYRLPEVMEKIPEFQAARRTSLHPAEIWKCFQLKVWDADANQMVGLSQLERSTSTVCPLAQSEAPQELNLENR